MSADPWQYQQLLEQQMWLADEAGIAEYESWAKKIEALREQDESRIEEVA